MSESIFSYLADILEQFDDIGGTFILPRSIEITSGYYADEIAGWVEFVLNYGNDTPCQITEAEDSISITHPGSKLFSLFAEYLRELDLKLYTVVPKEIGSEWETVVSFLEDLMYGLRADFQHQEFVNGVYCEILP